MDKTLLSILLPATGKCYDFWVPISIQMQNVAQLASRALELAEPDFYQSSPDAALMLLDTGEIQKPDATVGEIELANGDCLVLV